jgi:hypothetical protein
MNAHINLDLGIAAAETCPGEKIESLRDDFMAINNVLASLVDDVSGEIDRLSPWIDLLDNLSPKATDAIVNFSMEKALNAAWDFALLLAPLSGPEREATIREYDESMSRLASLVAKPPGFLFKIGLWVIRLRESSQITRNIEVLNLDPPAVAPATSGGVPLPP